MYRLSNLKSTYLYISIYLTKEITFVVFNVFKYYFISIKIIKTWHYNSYILDFILNILQGVGCGRKVEMRILAYEATVRLSASKLVPLIFLSVVVSGLRCKIGKMAPSNILVAMLVIGSTSYILLP